MACPNCNDDQIEYDNDENTWVLNVIDNGWTICISFCPFCGEELKSAGEACMRGAG